MIVKNEEANLPACLESAGDVFHEIIVVDTGSTDRTKEVAERYGDLGLGLTDATLVALAARLGTDRIATFDERHFRTVRTLGGGSFILLPMDGA